jgi:hypothetical protein
VKPLTIAVFCALSLAASSAFAEGGALPVAVFTSFDGAQSPQAIEAMKQEVDSIIRPSGINLSWRALDAPRLDEAFSDLVVVKFHGKCNMENIQLLFSELGPDNEAGGVLGSTKVSDGQVLPFSELECDRIRRSIAPLIIGNSPSEREALLGRAMGRVLAHELFHVFANTGKHGREGVAKTSHNRRDLIADRFEFAPRDAKRIERH